MRAAIVHSVGAVPEVGEWPEPDGGAAVVAAGLNPVDLRIASGTFYTGPPTVPYVPGGEAVVRLADGRRGYVAAAGAFAEQVAVDPAHVAAIPDAVDDGLALACGVAGSTALAALERARLAAGESVLVLGASGAVGSMAMQLAALLGAGSVTGASRSGEVGIGDIEDLGPFDVVVDPLWGEWAETAARALSRGGRLVQLGQSAGDSATFGSPLVRGRQIEILGLALPAQGPQRRRELFERLMAHAAAGELQAGAESYPLDAIAEAWERQASSPGVKLLIRP